MGISQSRTLNVSCVFTYTEKHLGKQKKTYTLVTTLTTQLTIDKIQETL